MLPFKKAKQYLLSPFNMEPETVGEYSIEVIDHPPGYKECAVSMRTAFMSGKPRASVIHPIGVRRHYLKHNGGTLMSDIAQEMIDFAEPIHRMTRLVAPSKVLIGGLGLGYIAHWAARLGHKATVVEIEPDIIKLTGKYLPPAHCEVVEADLLKYLATIDVRQYRFAIFDTWYATNEGAYWADVVPLRRAWAKAGGDPKNLWCWKEMDEMWSQVQQSAFMTWLWLKDHPDYKVDQQWTPNRIFLEGLFADYPHADQRTVLLYAELYTRSLGQTKTRARRWETMWGWRWDEAVKKAQEKHDAEAAQNTPQ